MMNLQLFAKKLNVDTSIVDYLKSEGKDSSFSARSNLAKELGISDYKGTAEQNLQMLGILKNGNTNTGAPAPSAPATEPAKYTPEADTYDQLNAPYVEGVDNSLIGTINSKFNPSANVTNAQNNANNALNAYTSMSAPSVSTDVMDTLNSSPTYSTAYTEAVAYTNAIREKLSSGKTSYTDQIKTMMNKIQNRDKFSYDVDTDMLFQQALASAMGSGKQAMQDTMGQASALTGGYASTYAQSAGNQAYNAFIEDAYNNLPEYYQMALDAYNMEGQDMYNQLAMLNEADATEYQRLYDSWNVNFANLQNMYSQEYGEWQDSVNNAYNMADLQLREQGLAIDQAYNSYLALQDNANTLHDQEYGEWRDSVNSAYNIANMQSDAYWSQVDENYRRDALQMDKELADREFNYGVQRDSIDDMWRNKEYLANYDLNNDGKVDAKDRAYAEANSDNSGYSQKDMSKFRQEALEKYNTGGDSAVDMYVDSLGLTDAEKADIAEYIYGSPEDNEDNGYGELPLEQRTFTKVDDTINWLWGVDNDDVVQDQYGNKYKISDLPESLRKKLTKLAKGESYTSK